DTWNLAALSPLTRRYLLGIGTFPVEYNHKKSAAWAQDDWQISNRLTLNLGVRYDLSTNAFANSAEVLPWVQGDRPDDTDNVQPRLGFAYRLDDRTVVRGGTGHYYQDPLTVDTFWTLSATQIVVLAVENDGRPDFAANPFNGPRPTFTEAQARFCSVNNVPGCLIRDVTELVAPPEYMDLSRNWQTSIGINRQFGETMAIEADYVYTRGKWEKQIIPNANLTYDPASGANFPFQDVSRRAFPEWGVVSMIPHTGRSRYHGLQTSFTKRLSNRWQASATYTLSRLKDADPQPFSGLAPVPFPVAPDLGNDFTLAESDQRHRAVLSGIWQVGYGLQVSAIHIWGSGLRDETTFGGDIRNLGAAGSARLRPDGTIVPRNGFVQPDAYRTDIRLQQRIPLGGRVSIDGIAEVFNVFNSANWTIETEESNRQFGQRVAGENRTAQFGFRLTF
ncbi:MAG: TonB-dependent receptor, partial [Acidobacteria bacterium]|nr:TonB-dependent receptor [Acidobacteriota bacterium]